MTIKASFPLQRGGSTRDLRPLCRELMGLISDLKRSIDEEIRTYPTPIPRCDAQFNHLYEERTRSGQLLERLHAVADRDESSLDLAPALADFVAAAPFTRRAEERALKERIAAALSLHAPASAAGPDRPPIDHASSHR